MPVVHSFDPPERFVTGTVGEPGQRAFFLQARTGTDLVSVGLEKQQVVALVSRLDELLDELMVVPGNESIVPAITPLGLHDSDPLEQPIVEQFRVGTLTLSWDPVDHRVIIEMFPVTEFAAQPESEDEDSFEPEELVVVRLAAGQARAFGSRSNQVIEAGRPDCPFCGNPVDPDGHLCVRANGFRRRVP